MDFLQIAVGAVAVLRERRVVVCSIGQTSQVQVRDLVTGVIVEANIVDLPARQTPELANGSNFSSDRPCCDLQVTLLPPFSARFGAGPRTVNHLVPVGCSKQVVREAG